MLSVPVSTDRCKPEYLYIVPSANNPNSQLIGRPCTMRTTVVLPTRVENHARLLSRHLTVYIFVVVLAIVGAFAYKLRTSTCICLPS